MVARFNNNWGNDTPDIKAQPPGGAPNVSEKCELLQILEVGILADSLELIQNYACKEPLRPVETKEGLVLGIYYVNNPFHSYSDLFSIVQTCLFLFRTQATLAGSSQP